MRIEQCLQADQPGWLALRQALWPESAADEHREEIGELIADPTRFANFIAYGADGQPIGLAEASLRSDYVNGTDGSPVVFLEGIYVVDQHRRQGIAEQLIKTVAGWGRDNGCTQMASDTSVDNHVSQAVHKALGFEETERVVYFKIDL